LAEWDGCRLKDKKDCTIKYSTTNKSCADIAQVVGIGANYLCNINKYVDNRKETYSDVYTVSFIKNRELVGTNTKKEILQYDGNVYCVNVESGMIITRYNDTTFISGNSEVRHHDAYSHLLEILGLNEEFAKLEENPVMKGRIRYLESALSQTNGTNREFSESVALFSLFIEHVSLFSQFLIIMAFNKHKNLLKGISNVVEATSKEEQIHGDFGIDLIKVIKEENPRWFNAEHEERVVKACKKAFKHENRLIDWIFEKGELDFLPKDVIKEFVKNRFNKSLESIGIEKIFDIDETLLSQTDWFDDEIIGTKHGDFFVKRSINYSKRTKSITSEDLF
jgi:ribonucleotide reductase beta subunit family protein with ferritin-like domain